MTEVEARNSLISAGGLVASGMMAMNLMVYGFTLISAHVLAPDEFGGLGAVLAILIVVSVGALALQATGARTIATAAPDLAHNAAANTLASARILSLILAVALLTLSPAVTQLLGVPWTVALLLPLAVLPLTMLGAYAGILQGCRRWRPLTAVFLGLGAGRLLCGGAALLLDATLINAVVGLTVGAYLPALIGWWNCRRLRAPAPGSPRHLAGEIWQNGHTLLAFFALTNLDVLLARTLLTPDESGLYAAGAILTKSCLFLPQFVIIVAFPTMAQEQAHNDRSTAWLRPLALVGLIGAVVTLGTAVLSDLAVTFVGGDQYAALGDYIWLFAIEGTLFAVLQMGVYRQIARRASVAPALWCAVAGLAVVALVTARVIEGFDQRTLVLLVIAFATTVTIPVLLAKSGRATQPAGG